MQQVFAVAVTTLKFSNKLKSFSNKGSCEISSVMTNVSTVFMFCKRFSTFLGMDKKLARKSKAAYSYVSNQSVHTLVISNDCSLPRNYKSLLQ